MKQCKRCKDLGLGPKLEAEFNKGSGIDGFQNLCREHSREANRVWVKANPEQNRAKAKRWRENNLARHLEIATNTRLRTSYGISLAQYNEMHRAQKYSCAICEKITWPVGTPRQDILQIGCVDHCHETGRVRGLLCFDCNTGLGKFQDSEKVLLNAVRYLRENATAQAQPSESRYRFEANEGRETGTLTELCGRESRRDTLSPFQFT